MRDKPEEHITEIEGAPFWTTGAVSFAVEQLLAMPYAQRHREIDQMQAVLDGGDVPPGLFYVEGCEPMYREVIALVMIYERRATGGEGEGA
jgi:hypothetical protein